MQLIRSILFSIFFCFWSAIVPIIYFPVFLTRSNKLANHGAKTWSKVSILALKIICKIDYQVKGLEKLPRNEAIIIACKHQSAWDTIIMNLIFAAPAYAYKKELLKIPLYGWFVKYMTGIPVDRSGKASALKNLVKQASFCLTNNHNIVIFPQGTRVAIDGDVSKYPYQIGVAALYKSCGAKIVPAALNSGLFWPSNSILKKSGIITLEFLDPIESGLSRDEFMQKLQEVTEAKSQELLTKNVKR